MVPEPRLPGEKRGHQRPQDRTIAMRRILLVEDEMFVAMDIERVVEKAGHQVVGFAGTAERAVALARNCAPT